jgi:hypothetical protein
MPRKKTPRPVKGKKTHVPVTDPGTPRARHAKVVAQVPRVRPIRIPGR